MLSQKNDNDFSRRLSVLFLTRPTSYRSIDSDDLMNLCIKMHWDCENRGYTGVSGFI